MKKYKIPIHFEAENKEEADKIVKNIKKLLPFIVDNFEDIITPLIGKGIKSLIKEKKIVKIYNKFKK